MEMNHCSVARKMIGLLAAPAVGVAVADLADAQELALLLEQLDDAGVGLPDLLAGKLGDLLG